MLRFLIYVAEVAIVVAVAVWLANRPGVVSLDWEGWRVETSVGILALSAFLLAVTAAGIFAVWRWIRRRPREWSMRRRLSRQEAGVRALSDGLVAIASGDADNARKHTRRVGSLLDHAPVTLLLEAQTAQIAGDEAAARAAFERMTQNEETEFLGLRGLITDALREGDDTRALSYAKRAYALKPRTPWVVDSMVSLLSRAGDWREAQRLIEESQKSKRSSSAQARRQQAALLTERARVARSSGEAADAYAQARKANELDPALVPAASLLAQLVAEDGRARRARKFLEKSWVAAPHPDLRDVYLGLLGPQTPPLETYKAVEALVRSTPEHPESHLALARAALDANLWGEAHRRLDELQAVAPTAGVYRLRARLADEDAEDMTTPAEWLELAASAESDRAWVCGDCGTVADDWSAVCGHCGAFATLGWSQPPRIHRALAHSGGDDSITNAPETLSSAGVPGSA
ncbi:MAG: heme biosynthesis protein HemY [Rhodospirillaceae bacterium]|jgi:HemY protein|nr:heme biosynthesis protein HemY [Rhodospirillaceae bacterium]MBT3810838.1 heme biosynthesis protein HemY [Rhodospirillaceae bacterium]MBT3930607.1 heme biosynthesis protein HemY [Rhodospirillaceae bacterium]MBT4773610.1 heme biosynthesis protein HemY [Rhodospirillaceae bacterium]MBT5360030.1 heme biosynthesis protein HemY [Rhodospirillaceae bacterium]